MASGKLLAGKLNLDELLYVCVNIIPIHLLWFGIRASKYKLLRTCDA